MWIDYENFARNNLHINNLFGHQNHDETIFNDEDKFIDRMLRNENDVIHIRVSLFECPPYVIYERHQSNKTRRLDGAEFRCLEEITKNWKITFTYRDLSTDITHPWNISLKDLHQNISDVSTCSIWLSEHHYRYFDLSKFIDFQCITFLVPKPMALTQASNIYLPYQTSVWIIFVIVMSIILVLIKLSAWLETRIHENLFGDNKYNNITMILLELINIMTAHGLVKFPKCLIFKILFMSCILLSFLIDVGYVTGYTSLLAIPRYSKSIDTLKEFLAQDIHWSERDVGTYKGEFLRTENTDFISLANQFIYEESEEHRYKLLAGHKFSRVVKIISNSFVTDTNVFGPYINEMQPMKTCLFEYYTTFAFPKSSPFKKIFDRQILRIHEAGLFEPWFRDIELQHPDDMKRFSHHHIESSSVNSILTVANLTGVFYLWCIGLGVAIFTFIGELVWFRVCKRFYF